MQADLQNALMQALYKCITATLFSRRFYNLTFSLHTIKISHKLDNAQEQWTSFITVQ